MGAGVGWGTIIIHSLARVGTGAGVGWGTIGMGAIHPPFWHLVHIAHPLGRDDHHSRTCPRGHGASLYRPSVGPLSSAGRLEISIDCPYCSTALSFQPARA